MRDTAQMSIFIFDSEPLIIQKSTWWCKLIDKFSGWILLQHSVRIATDKFLKSDEIKTSFLAVTRHRSFPRVSNWNSWSAFMRSTSSQFRIPGRRIVGWINVSVWWFAMTHSWSGHVEKWSFVSSSRELITSFIHSSWNESRLNFWNKFN